MKKLIFVATVIICAIATSFAQSKTPTAVTTAFNQKFLKATKVKWDKENAHEYEAGFEWKGAKYSANFSDTGEWLETESSITFNQLPEKVQIAFNSSHKGATVKAVAKIETSKNITKYEVEIKKGVKTVEFFYTAEGTETK
jgi:Putative beta-lactamase-inhibitor-like, PepSY-like